MDHLVQVTYFTYVVSNWLTQVAFLNRETFLKVPSLTIVYVLSKKDGLQLLFQIIIGKATRLYRVTKLTEVATES